MHENLPTFELTARRYFLYTEYLVSGLYRVDHAVYINCLLLLKAVSWRISSDLTDAHKPGPASVTSQAPTTGTAQEIRVPFTTS